MVWPDVLVAYYRRIDPKVLLHGTPATVLDRGALLDDEGDRGGPTLGRLLEGVSRERARRLRGILPLKSSPMAEDIQAVEVSTRNRRIWTSANENRTKEGSASSVILVQAIRNTSSAIVPA